MANGFYVFLLIVAYLMGSFSTAVWIGRWFYRVDVREYGSGNAGATNAFRVLGPKVGVSVLLIDVMKGTIAVYLSYLPRLFNIAYSLPGTEQFTNLQLALGIAVLLGHIFPVFSGLRGGKGIGTILGIVIAVHPMSAVLLMVVFLGVLLVFRYVSLSSMAAALAFPILVMGLFQNTIPSLNIFATFVPILVLITHQKNIERLLKREESRVKIFKKGNEKNRNTLKKAD